MFCFITKIVIQAKFDSDEIFEHKIILLKRIGEFVKRQICVTKSSIFSVLPFRSSGLEGVFCLLKNNSNDENTSRSRTQSIARAD